MERGIQTDQREVSLLIHNMRLYNREGEPGRSMKGVGWYGENEGLGK